MKHAQTDINVFPMRQTEMTLEKEVKDTDDSEDLFVAGAAAVVTANDSDDMLEQAQSDVATPGQCACEEADEPYSGDEGVHAILPEVRAVVTEGNNDHGMNVRQRATSTPKGLTLGGNGTTPCPGNV